jgi:hypothetical protein
MSSFQAYKELGLLMLLVGVAVLTFSSLVNLQLQLIIRGIYTKHKI